MNASGKLETDEILRIRLGVMKNEHRDLDLAISVIEDRGIPEPLTIRRLKKQKLALKDRIAQIEDRLTPDIIA